MLAPVRMDFAPAPTNLVPVRTCFVPRQLIFAGLRMIPAGGRMNLARMGIGLGPVRRLPAPAQTGLAPARTRLNRQPTLLGRGRRRLARARTQLGFTRALPAVTRLSRYFNNCHVDRARRPLENLPAIIQPKAFIMNQDQLNITGMHSTVADYLTKNNPVWSGVKAVSDAVTALKTNNSVIAQKANEQQTATDGAVAAKVQTKHDLEEKILEIADQLSSLAAKNSDVNLAAQVEVSLSALDKMDDDQLEATGKNISALATANIAALADYNVLPADVTALDGLVTAWDKVKTAPRTAIAQRSSQTKTLPQANSDNTSLLRTQLDKQMTKFKKTNPEFYAG